MDNQERIKKLKKFTTDRDWQLIIDLMDEHMNPLHDVMTIDVKKSNDEIASEVRGRQLTISGLTRFLNDAKITSIITTNNKTTFQ